MKAIDYAKGLCDTMMNKSEASELPPVGHFHYHQGVFLSGVQALYGVCNEKKYLNYTQAWVDAMLGEDGIPKEIITTEPDDLQPGVLLFLLYGETGDEKYKKLLDQLIVWMMALKTNPLGGTWHKASFENEMWMDSMYMVGVLTSQYAKKFGNETHRKFVHRQMELMREYAKDEKTGLYYHGWDYSKKAMWADPVTGCSKNFWGRAIGWFAVAMFEIAKTLEKGTVEYRDYVKTGIDLIESLLNFRDEKTGMWYQVVDKGDMDGNWIETSCSCLFLYAIGLATELGELDKEKIRPIAEHSFKGICDSLNKGDDGYIGVRNVCIGTGIDEGTYEHYIARPTVENDLHGAGAFLLMCAKYAEIFENDN